MRVTAETVSIEDMNVTGERVIEYVDVHAEGEVGRILLSGFPDVPGETLVDKMNYINTVDDTVLKMAMFEPRGSAMMTVNLLFPPVSQGAHAAFIPMQPDGAHAMSGSNAMCVATMLVETGRVPSQNGTLAIRLDTPAGVVDVKVQVEGGKVLLATVSMPQSFAEKLDQSISVPEIGTVKVDIAFGGCYFALADASALGVSIVPGEARKLVDLGLRIQKAANEQLTVQHPLVPAFNAIEYTMFTDRVDGSYRNGTVLFPGRMDRSPCGTGTSARLAVMHAKGDLCIGDYIEASSIIGGIFRSRISGQETTAGLDMIQPEISGRTWISGEGKFRFHPTDPYLTGYTLTDTWGTGQVRK